MMLGSFVVYCGLLLAAFGFVTIVKPSRRLRVSTRRRAMGVTATGLGFVLIGVLLPAPERRVSHPQSHLDEFLPVWQFSEHHTLRIAAPPARVHQAIRGVRADEILLFRTLTWIRRGGRRQPESILNAGDRDPLLDVATRNGFIWLADDPPREVVVGAVIVAPRPKPGSRRTLTPDVFLKPLPPGLVLAAMNFEVRDDGAGGSLVSTETRVFASSAAARRRFAAYWRVIYPGSSLIRVMWLRAIRARAERSQ
jgi:hypothetical protein